MQNETNTFCLLFAALYSSSNVLLADTQHDWENPAIVQINREPVRATFTPYMSVERAAEMGTPFRQMSLNGSWKFHWAPGPEERPKEFYKKDFDTSGWDSIVVPGNWQTQGFGVPIYLNIGRI